MNWDQVEGQSKELTGFARRCSKILTDNDWETIAGKEDQLVGLIQERYGLAKAGAERQAEEWSSALKEAGQRIRSVTGPKNQASGRNGNQ